MAKQMLVLVASMFVSVASFAQEGAAPAGDKPAVEAAPAGDAHAAKPAKMKKDKKGGKKAKKGGM